MGFPFLFGLAGRRAPTGHCGYFWIEIQWIRPRRQVADPMGGILQFDLRQTPLIPNSRYVILKCYNFVDL